MAALTGKLALPLNPENGLEGPRTIAITVDDGPDPQLFDALCREYLGRVDATAPLRDSATAVVVSVAIEEISGNGPWRP